MTILYIDGKHAILAGQSIKLNIENPYFTKSSTYTLEVSLPLEFAENRAIFGRLNRMDQHREPKTLPATLIVDNVTMLDGECRLLSVTENSVKVQLLGENSAYNFRNRMAEVYVDELDLGNWYKELYPDLSYWDPAAAAPGPQVMAGDWRTYDATDLPLTTGALARRFADGDWTDLDAPKRIAAKMMSAHDWWVALPTLNSASGTTHNGLVFHRDGLGFSAAFNMGYLSPQPKVWWIAQRVAQATGYELPPLDNYLRSNALYYAIFIVNTNNLTNVAKVLPHWTVAEFWAAIEDTFGVVMMVDERRKQIKLIARGEYFYKADVRKLCLVSDNFTADIDTDESSDISSNNVAFDDDAPSPYDILPDEIKENAHYVDDYPTVEDIITMLSSAGASREAWLDVVFCTNDGRRYIYNHSHDGSPAVVEVDMLRARVTDESKDESQISLKIVPAHNSYGESSLAWPTGAALSRFAVKMIEVAGSTEIEELGEEYTESLVVADVLNGESEFQGSSSDAPDTLYIAIDKSYRDLYHVEYDSGSGQQGVDLLIPRAITRGQQIYRLDGTSESEIFSVGLELNYREGVANLYSESGAGVMNIDTKVKHCFTFLTNSTPPITAVYSICGRRYVCEKMELSITSDGASELITGYFYELEL